MSRARELALLGALLCATAALLDVPALYMPGLAALLAAALARGWVTLSAGHARVTLRSESVTVQEGERIEFTVGVRRGALPFPGGALLPWPGAQELGLPKGRSAEIVAGAFVSRRGRQTVGPALLRIADPFGIETRELSSATAELLVLPRLHALGAAALAHLDGAGRSLRETAQEVDSLRAHRPGSPASRIHWPTVARAGVLMEHSMRSASDPRVLVELDAESPESEDALDQALRAAASLCHHFARRGGCLLLLPEDRRPRLVSSDMRAWPELHARFALVTPRPSARRAPAKRQAATLIRVSARAAAPEQVTGPHYRLAPTPLPRLAVGFEVAGCCGQFIDAGTGVRAA